MPTNNSINETTDGMQSLTSAGAFIGRTLVGSAGITISNPTGTAGDPTVAIGNPMNSATFLSTKKGSAGPINNGVSATWDVSSFSSGNRFSIAGLCDQANNSRAFGFYVRNTNANSAIAVNITSTTSTLSTTVAGAYRLTNGTAGANQSYTAYRISHYV